MKNIIILDCGPSLSEITEEFGYAPEWIISMLHNTKHNYKWIKSYEGETIEVTQGDAWILTGSPRSVYEELDWMLDLEVKIRELQKMHTPVLGICFGHQIIAKSLGGEVKLNPAGWELGAYPIQLTEDGMKSKILSGINDNDIVYQSHRDCITCLPNNAIKLAFNNKGIQAFSINKYIYGVQFHPEFSWAVIKKYVSIRSAMGILVDNQNIPKSNAGQAIVHNFLELIV